MARWEALMALCNSAAHFCFSLPVAPEDLSEI